MRRNTGGERRGIKLSGSRSGIIDTEKAVLPKVRECRNWKTGVTRLHNQYCLLVDLVKILSRLVISRRGTRKGGVEAALRCWCRLRRGGRWKRCGQE